MGNRSLSDLPGASSPGYNFVLQESLADLLNALSEFGFEVWDIHGSKIRDDVTLFTEVLRNLDDPADFGNDWDAFRDVLGDLEVGGRRAIIWHDFPASLAQNLGVTLDALYLIREVSTPLLPERCLAIYLLGQGKEYPPLVWVSHKP